MNPNGTLITQTMLILIECFSRSVVICLFCVICVPVNYTYTPINTMVKTENPATALILKNASSTSSAFFCSR